MSKPADIWEAQSIQRWANHSIHWLHWMLYISVLLCFSAQRFAVPRQRWRRQLRLHHAAARQEQSHQEEDSREETRPQSWVQWEARLLSQSRIHPDANTNHHLLLSPWKIWVPSSIGRVEVQATQCVGEKQLRLVQESWRCWTGAFMCTCTFSLTDEAIR